MNAFNLRSVLQNFCASVFVLVLAFSLFAAARPAVAAPVITLQEVANGLQSPVEMVHSGDGSGRLFVLEQAGKVRLLQNGVLSPTPFLDITSSVGSGGEKGLLGIAFHPQYAVNRAFYVYYTRTGDGALTIARYLRSATDPARADPASGAVILTIPHPNYQNHNGGHLAFGFDGYLYIGTGDGGGGGDPDRNSQNLTSRLGKMLRIAVDGGASYTIPPTNPYASSTCAAQCPEIWAYGLRNPWKFTFDRANGDLFIGDVGQGLYEEINHVTAGSAGGKNFGWNTYEASSCYSPSSNCSLPNHTPPIIEYGHNNTNFGGFSVTGGYRYRGSQNKSMAGYYFYGDFSSQRIWAAIPDASGKWVSEFLLLAPSSISSFAEDEAGELYVVGYVTGKIYAIKTASGAEAKKLSLSASVADSRIGSPVTLTALVRGAAPITGTMAFLRVVQGDIAEAVPDCARVPVRALPGDVSAAVATCATTVVPTLSSYFVSYDDGSGNGMPPALTAVRSLANGPQNYNDLWWAGKSEDGWGATIVQKGTQQFNVLYTYDNAGKPLWYAMSGGNWNADFTRFSGALYQPASAPFNAYDASRFNAGAPVGNATIAYTGSSTATLEYTINGVSGSKNISRLIYGAADASARLNVQDIWWAGTAENGWGINITQQERTLFAAWYTYDAAGKTTWYVMTGGNWFGSVYSGLLYTATSSAWLGTAYDATKFRAQPVGSLTLNFSDQENALMTYNVNGVTQTKAITRLRF